MDSKYILYLSIQANSLLALTFLTYYAVLQLTVLLAIAIALIVISMLYLMFTQRLESANPYFVCLSSFLLLFVQTETFKQPCCLQLILVNIYQNKIYQIYRQQIIQKNKSISLLYLAQYIYLISRVYIVLIDVEALFQIILAFIGCCLLLADYFSNRTSILNILDDTINNGILSFSKQKPMNQSLNCTQVVDIPEINLKSTEDYSAFDLFPNASIILGKNSKGELGINYVNKLITQVFKTTDSQQILSTILNLQNEDSNGDLQIAGACSMPSYSSAIRVNQRDDEHDQVKSRQSHYLKPNSSEKFERCSVYTTVKNKNLKPTRSINISQNDKQKFEGFKSLRTMTFAEFGNQQATHKCSIHRDESASHLRQSDGPSDKLTKESKFSNVIDQLWNQTQVVSQDCKGQHQDLVYIGESGVFVTKLMLSSRVIFLDLKAYKALHKGKIIIIIIIRDVTYRDYIKTLRSYSSQKSLTLSFVSHELRTPLNCSINCLESLLDKHTVKDQSDIELIKSANMNIKYCLNIAQDLLDLAQLKSGNFQLNIKPFNLNQVITDCIQMFKMQARKQGVAINLSYLSQQIVESDEQRIRQVVINLVNNALKFTIRGSITVSCINDYDHFILVEVIDTGIGVKKEDQPKLLKAFGKVKDNETKQLNAQGVGLGLIISHKIAQQLSDNSSGLGFISEYGEGSTFCFRFKNYLEQQDEEGYQDFVDVEYKPVEYNMKGLSQSIVQHHSENQPILIVDDNQFNIEALKIMLFKCIQTQQTIEYTISGYIAEEMCLKRLKEHNPFRIIFMDIEMPFQNGIVTSKKIRQQYREHNQQIVIIGCSSYTSQNEILECLQEMDDYIIKPVQKEKLQELFVKYYYS